MATIALQVAGTALGTVLGGPLGGALGSALGGAFGATIDRAVLGGKTTRIGPRLTTMNGISAAEGAAIPRIYGRVRLGGQVIWATEFEEEQQIERAGRSGGKGARQPSGGRTLTYAYYANVAIGLCEGPVNLIRRIWADGKELDLSGLNWRFYHGDATQQPDPLIVAKQETGEVPAFRGLAYVVFERFPLADYGNRLPQFSFELVRAAPGLPERLRAINIIPGSTEFGYSVSEVREDFGFGSSRALNRSQLTHESDWEASLSDLLALAPNLERATLVSAWFGDDLRAGLCTLRPKVEKSGKITTGKTWRVAGLDRASAQAVSATDGRPNYGGSPDDASVVEAIRDLKARGLKVALHPFILMDIPVGNALPDPYSGSAGQAAFPWRGRITCHPAPGQPGSPEGSATADAQVAAFVGTASAAHFSLSGETVLYAGPQEWSLRRMVLHHAMLAKAAGGVDTFILASELVGLTHLAGSANSFPFVSALTGLLAELRAILGPACTLTYAADWTEYGARVRQGGQSVRFPLDPLWAHAEIGAIGVDFYPPLSDWRMSGPNLDSAVANHAAQHDYLKARIASGEAFDFYYADANARTNQTRSAITDGAYGKPWVFRPKDLKGFWSNAHFERSGGVESTTPTAFVPGSRPILLTEIGCPAVARGANQPNVFPDPKSSENALPHHSSGARDDLVQRRLIEAFFDRFDPASGGFDPTANPAATLYAGRMVAPDFIAPWAWDARPFPAFPRQTSQWADGPNWLRGHWLNGRLEAVPLRELIGMIAADFGVAMPQVEDIEGMLNGFVIERVMSARAALEALVEAFSLKAVARAGGVAVRSRPAPILALAEDDLVPGSGEALVECVRGQASELPARLSLGILDDEDDFQPRIVTASTATQESGQDEALEGAFLMPRAAARRLVESRLARRLEERERFSFRLAHRHLGIEVGDALSLPTPAGPRAVVVTRIADARSRECEAVPLPPPPSDVLALMDELPAEPGTPAVPGAAHARLLELPLAQEGAGLLQALVRAEPWRGPYAIIDTTNGAARTIASVVAPARVGQTMSPLPPGPLWRWDHKAVLDVTLAAGALAGLGEEAVLAGGNALALASSESEIEIVLFRTAELVGQRRYRLTGLLRGIGLSERAAGRTLPAGAEVTVLDDALVDLGLGPQEINARRDFTVLPAGRALGDPASVTLQATPLGVSLVPLAPVHPRARREAGGTRISFIRRARWGGDSWDLFEVPLAESREAYRLEVLAGGQVKRNIELAAPEYLYATADELADFGTVQSVLTLRIRQISDAVGPGAPLEATLTIS